MPNTYEYGQITPYLDGRVTFKGGERVKMPKGKTELWRTAISGRYVSDNAGFAIFKSSDVTVLQMLSDYKIVMAEKSHLLIYGTGSYEYFCKLCADVSKFLRSLPDIK